MKTVLIGIDVGTTRIKAVAVDPDLVVLGEHAVPTPWRHEGARADLDPRAVATATATAATGAARVASGSVVAVGVTGMAETGVLLDEHAVPLAPALAWHDPRADCDAVRAEIGDETYRRTAGRAIDSVSSLPKLLWLYQHVEGASRAVRFLSLPEWTVHALGGDQVNELSLVSRTGLFDVPRKVPWDDTLAMLNAGSTFLGEIVAAGQPVGRVSESAPEELRGAVLTVAGHDHQTAGYALGAAVEGALFDSLGTAEALLRTVRPPLDLDAIDRLAQQNVTTGWGVVPDRLSLLAGVATGISLERIGRLVGAPTPSDRIALGHRALSTDRSATSMRISATYHGVTLHDIDDEVDAPVVWRVAVEDLAHAVAAVLAAMAAEAGAHRDVVVGGGWLHNPMVRMAKERQFATMRASTVAEPGALGAAEMGGVAAGLIAPRWSEGA